MTCTKNSQRRRSRMSSNNMIPGDKKPERAKDRHSSLVRLMILMKPYTGTLIICAICVLIVNLAELGKPYVAKIIIDDFLANGNAAKGIIDLVNQAGATLSGMGFLVEKSFQHGGDFLRAQNFPVESLAIIDSLDDCKITFKD